MKLIRSTLDLESRVRVMGALNVTPDSFSDGGKYNDLESATARAFEIEAEGADILDIGGESTRPGASPVRAEEELRRVMPVIEALSGRLRIPISIDTTKGEVARAAARAGAEIINDISGLRFDPGLAEIAAETGAALVLTHSRGAAETLHQMPPVDDVFTEVIGGLRRSIEEALRRGARRDQIILDPGIGFGKTPEQNLQLINGLDRIVTEFGLPVLLGTSRKSFIKRTLDRILPSDARDKASDAPDEASDAREERERRAGTAATVAIGVLRGARVVRVHDVGEMAVVIRIAEAVKNSVVKENA
jgi:dihydropteroate synthase